MSDDEEYRDIQTRYGGTDSLSPNDPKVRAANIEAKYARRKLKNASKQAAKSEIVLKVPTKKRR